MGLPDVPLLVAVCLVAGSFYAGHWTQRVHDASSASSISMATAPILAPQETSKHLTRARDLVAGQALQQPMMPPANPLDTAELERYMLEASGFLKVRGALPPAGSGDPFVRVIPFQILSWYPRMVVYPAFIDPARCRDIINIANTSLYKSDLAYRPGEEAKSNQQVRTSSGTYLSADYDGPAGSMAWLEERLAAAGLMSSALGEPFNVLKYEPGQHYDSHMDSFDPKEYGNQPSQRAATFLVILAAPEEGGETVFKREGQGNESRIIQEWRSCNSSEDYMYKPRAGDALLFHNIDTRGDIDAHALHGGCPVIKGEKWVATKWVRTKTVGMGDRAAELEQAVLEQQLVKKEAPLTASSNSA